jgi:uncharacterized protein YndB with AHSA1/START domain
MLRIDHAAGRATFGQPPAVVFDAFTQWTGYERWAPDLQTSAHWLSVQAGGPGSRFVLYDKPGPRHLAHFGVVTDLDSPRSFSWRAPFSEWPRAFMGSSLELTLTEHGGTEGTEHVFFEARECDLPALAGFLRTEGFDEETFARFLDARLAGLARLLDGGAPLREADAPLFSTSRQVAGDWSGAHLRR